MTSAIRGFAVIGVSSLLCSCDKPKLPPVEPTTKIWVEYGVAGYEWKSIDDPLQIQKVTEFINSRRSQKWFSAFAGAPSTKIRLLLYNGKKYNGFFGYGSGEFLCFDYRQKASASEIHEFVRLLGLESE